MEQDTVDDGGTSALAQVSSWPSLWGWVGSNMRDLRSREGVQTTEIELAVKVLDCDGAFFGFSLYALT